MCTRLLLLLFFLFFLPSIVLSLSSFLSFLVFNYYSCSNPCCGSGSVAGIATGYGLDGLGIESLWERDFMHLSRPALGPT